ncbi:hypothetical protein [Leuconostoc fallax]|uniref:hypothetical protein n=1 Tax=Leuconostoc fallax TaxID=1251 RepID=UPI001C1EFDA3|nr:hypothetical protein [Leuconostoc fallax]MBU7455693.1 hypothetical protein [Leuconostoc fallax]
MDKALKKQRQRVRHIKEATEVNKKLIADQDRRSDERRKRHGIQVRSEIRDMHNLDYIKHMELG